MAALNRTTSGLLLRTDFSAADGWTAGTGFSRVSDPTMVTWGKVWDLAGPTSGDSSDEYNGRRDGQVFVEGSRSYLFVDSGNNPTPHGGIFCLTSDDGGITWTARGGMSCFNADGAGGSLDPGEAWGGWFAKWGATYRTERFCALQNFGGSNEWIPLMPAYSDVWTCTTSPLGTYTYNSKIIPGTGWNAYSVWVTCMVRDSDGTYYRILGGEDNPVTAQFCGYESASSLSGPWTRSANQINNTLWNDGQTAEEVRWFHHQQLNRWIGVCNLIAGGTGLFTNANGLISSSSISDWSSAKYYVMQRVGAVLDTSNNAIGMPAHFTGPDGAVINEAGFVPFVFDCDPRLTDSWGTNAPGYHRGRHVFAGILEPSSNALLFSDTSGTQRRYSHPLVHTDFVAEFEVDVAALATGSYCALEYRVNGSAGYRMMVRMESGHQQMQLEDLAGNLLAGGAGAQVIAPGVSTRIRVAVTGGLHQGYLDGELQIALFEGFVTSGTEVAITGKNNTWGMRLFSMYGSDTITIRGLPPSTPTYLRTFGRVPVAQVTPDANGVATYAGTHYPIAGVDVSPGNYAQAPSILLWGGDDGTVYNNPSRVRI